MTRLTRFAGILTLALAGCGTGAAQGGAGGSGGQVEGDGGSNASGGALASGGSSSGGSLGGQAGDGSGGGAPGPSTQCGETIEPSAVQIEVGPADDLAEAVATAPAGATVLLADGTYDVGADGLWIGADSVIIRAASADASRVILDGGYRQTSGGILNVAGKSDVTLAHLTITRGRYHLVHVTGGPEGPSAGARLYDLQLVDPGEQAVKVNSNYDFDSDEGELACSRLLLTDAGRSVVMQNEAAGSSCYTGGIDAHRAQGWTVRDNVIEGFWCSSDLSEHGIHFWRGSRDTVIQRNLLIDNARGIGLGLGQPGSGRTYDDSPCGGQAAEHYGGTVENNMIVGRRPELFSSPSGMDLGVGLEAACEVLVLHNTVASTEAPFSSMEWRWPETSVRALNNLVTHELRTRDGASAELVSNVTNAPLSTFVDIEAADAHLASASTASPGAPEGAELSPLDLDGDARTGTPHVGADQAGP